MSLDLKSGYWQVEMDRGCIALLVTYAMLKLMPNCLLLPNCSTFGIHAVDLLPNWAFMLSCCLTFCLKCKFDRSSFILVEHYGISSLFRGISRGAPS